MWPCASCEYVNDDWDESCLRCGVDRVTSDAERAALAAAAAEAVIEEKPQLSELEQRILESTRRAETEPEVGSATDATELTKTARSGATPGGSASDELQRDVQASADELLAAEVERSGGLPPESVVQRRNELAPILIIAICLLGLCAIAFVAWNRGMIKLPERKAAQAIDFAEIGFESRPAYQNNESLSNLLESKSKGIRPLKAHAQLLLDCQAAYAAILAELNPPPEQDKLLRQLDRTAAVSRLMAEDYTRFETETVPRNRRLDANEVAMLREQYAALSGQLMVILRVGYIGLEEPQHPAFLYTDSLPVLFDKYGFIEADNFSEQWQAIREERRQLELDVQYADLIDELEVWYSTLAGLHEEVDKVIRSLGEVSSNRGRLNPAAVKLVVLLDDYASKIEGLNTDFEGYAAELPATESDTVNELLESFRALALEDHMYCFMEIYRRYVEDKYAELEQYDRLLDHYEYAEQWWPHKKGDYQGIYTAYENRWKENWVE